MPKYSMRFSLGAISNRYGEKPILLPEIINPTKKNTIPNTIGEELDKIIATIGIIPPIVIQIPTIVFAFHLLPIYPQKKVEISFPNKMINR